MSDLNDLLESLGITANKPLNFIQAIEACKQTKESYICEQENLKITIVKNNENVQIDYVNQELRMLYSINENMDIEVTQKLIHIFFEDTNIYEWEFYQN